MNRSLFLCSLMLCVSSTTAAQQDAPGDSARIVILSERVGPVISPAGREKYHVFSQFEGFMQAVVLQLPDSSYTVRVTLHSGAGVRDTLVRYSGTTILMIADKIEHIEELESGTYVLGSHPPSLKYASGGVSVPPAVVPRNPAGPSGSELSPRGAGERRADSSRQIPRTRYGFESLPLARAPGLHLPRYYPAFAFAFGIRTFAPDLSGLGAAAGGSPSFNVSPMIDILPELLITEETGIQVDAGIATEEKCYTSSLSLVLYAHPFDDPGWRPFLEGGYVWTSMAGSTNGIDFTAGGRGVRVGAGIEINIGAVAAIALDVCYNRIARKSSVFSDWQIGDQAAGPVPISIPVSVDLSSFQFGLRIKVQ